MKIEKDTVVTMRCRIADDKGLLIQDGKAPMSYLHGGHGNTLPKIEEALEGKAVGEQLSLVLTPADAFGEPDPTCYAPSPSAISRRGSRWAGSSSCPGRRASRTASQ